MIRTTTPMQRPQRVATTAQQRHVLQQIALAERAMLPGGLTPEELGQAQHLARVQAAHNRDLHTQPPTSELAEYLAEERELAALRRQAQRLRHRTTSTLLVCTWLAGAVALAAWMQHPAMQPDTAHAMAAQASGGAHSNSPSNRNP